MGEEAIARRILRYLIEHAGARSTVESIAEWWLLEQSIQERLEEVRRALALLVHAGLLLEKRGIYELNHARMNDIRDLLASDG